MPPSDPQKAPVVHAYPLRLALAALRFVQGSMYYSAITDVAVNQYIRSTSHALDNIKMAFSQKGISEEDWEIGWACLDDYLKVFPNPVFQNTLFSMRVHWDWYIGKLGKFVEFARQYVRGPYMDGKLKKNLTYIGYKDIVVQLEILEQSTGIKIHLEDAVIESIKEMSLVRNLGMHNCWEIDEIYLRSTRKPGWKAGQLRHITLPELMDWKTSLDAVIQETSYLTAETYSAAPDYQQATNDLLES